MIPDHAASEDSPRPRYNGPRVVKYRVVSETTPDRFNDEALRMLDEGLQPYGKVHAHVDYVPDRRTVFTQAFAAYA